MELQTKRKEIKQTAITRTYSHSDHSTNGRPQAKRSSPSCWGGGGTSYLFNKFISVVSTILLYHTYVWWMVCGWMAWPGLLVVVVKCVGKFSLPGGGLIISFFCTIVAGFGISMKIVVFNSDLIDIM